MKNQLSYVESDDRKIKEFQRGLINEGFIKNKNSRLDQKIDEFCEKNVARFDESGGSQLYNTKGAKDGSKYNYLNMVKDGSTALLRAMTISLDKIYNQNILVCD